MKAVWVLVLGLALKTAPVAWAGQPIAEVTLPADAVNLKLGAVREELRPLVDEECVERSKTLGPFDDLGTNCRVWVKTGLWTVSISYEREGFPSTHERFTEAASLDPESLGLRAGSKAWKGLEKRLELHAALAWFSEIHEGRVIWAQSDAEPSQQGPAVEARWQRLRVSVQLKD
jgi:hypothetical protein